LPVVRIFRCVDARQTVTQRESRPDFSTEPHRRPSTRLALFTGMGTPYYSTVDGNEAVASVAHRTNEIIAIYPITPSSTMGELADEWSSASRTNIWGQVPQIVEMQSEAGAIGAVHGALQAGALATTFTASQGLLLMIPNLYKIAGELMPFAMHVAARTVATHALSIFGDHSDVMGVRQTGVAMLASGSVQEAHDFALIAQASTLRSRVPFIHFFDGFRTSHEVARIHLLEDETLRAMLDEDAIAAVRQRALTPDAPTLRGTAQNPDVFFQAREACNLHYLAVPHVVSNAMNRFEALTGRAYRLFDYAGDPDATRVIVMMGSGAETAQETVEYLCARGEKVGVLKVRLYRPFAAERFIAALPRTVRQIAVLDRTKEPGALGEPLYLDIVAALHESADAGRLHTPVAIVGGRYGLSSKEFTPAMVKAVFDNLQLTPPRNHFTVGIVDDVTHTSLAVPSDFDIEPADVVRCVFFGLGSDGTVGANKNSIKIIGEDTEFWPQGYFVYDSKKSGALTISHLRFGPRPIKSAYLISKAGFVACHQPTLLDRYDVLEVADQGATILLNTPYRPDEIWEHLPAPVRATIVDKRLRLFVIDAYAVADETGMGRHINTIMQTCFFAISNVLPQARALEKIRGAIEKTYRRRGADVVEKNFQAVDAALAHLHEVAVPSQAAAEPARFAVPLADAAPAFVRRVTAVMLANHGDRLPVSAFPVDGTWPTGTARWEKRNLAQQIPVWDDGLCIQCNKCAEICPHAAIRAKVYPGDCLASPPPTFKNTAWKGTELRGQRYSLQVAPEDCTGCELCVAMCPAHEKNNPGHRALAMAAQGPLRDGERANWEYFLALPEADRSQLKRDAKSVQLLQPLFEFSGACSGCGETPYIKLLTQLFGDRLLVANATGCSSIFGGNLPTTPYAMDSCGRGPAWANSLFEDNAEFGLGFRLALDSRLQQARALVTALTPRIGAELAAGVLNASQSTEAEIAAQRNRIADLRVRLAACDEPNARQLLLLVDALVQKSVWIVGGDGWAYDIGFGGVDHVLSTGRKVNMLVMDTEVYSNTGGQQSKATPIGASAKFAVGGKSQAKKDLGLMAMTYGHVYVGRIALGAKDAHAVKVLQEAEAFPGPSLVIAYAHCVAHGYDLSGGVDHQRMAVDSGYWPLYRYDPRRAEQGLPPLQLDSGPGNRDLLDYMESENRFRVIQQHSPERFAELVELARHEQSVRRALYEQLSAPRT
jgi:pyruvate-ferredoxin/flavodoxin oxidoreductase